MEPLPIPKIIHQIWIGPHRPPTEWLDTWSKMNPTWEHRIWRSYDDFEMKKFIDNVPSWHGKSDPMRYEILFRHGGVYIDADTECTRPLDDLFLTSPWATFEHEEGPDKLIASGFIGVAPASDWMRALMDGLLANPALARHIYPWLALGPGYFTEMIRKRFARSVRVLPARTFLPFHARGTAAPGNAPSYGTHHWFSTRGMGVDPATGGAQAVQLGRGSPYRPAFSQRAGVTPRR